MCVNGTKLYRRAQFRERRFLSTTESVSIRADTFQVLGVSASICASAALAFNWYPLPVAGSALELAYCSQSVLFWVANARIWRWLMPQVHWDADPDAVSLIANVRAA